MNILNLTPHTINLCGQEIPSSGVARCATITEQVGEINGIPVNRTVMGEVTGLPSQQDGTIIIVSRIVAEAVKCSRKDCVIVDKTIRDEQGRIVGCNALAVI